MCIHRDCLDATNVHSQRLFGATNVHSQRLPRCHQCAFTEIVWMPPIYIHRDCLDVKQYTFTDIIQCHQCAFTEIIQCHQYRFTEIVTMSPMCIHRDCPDVANIHSQRLCHSEWPVQQQKCSKIGMTDSIKEVERAVEKCDVFNVLLLAYKVPNGLAQMYFSELLQKKVKDSDIRIRT